MTSISISSSVEVVETRDLLGRHKNCLLHTVEGLVTRGGGSHVCICADDHDSDQYSSTRTKLFAICDNPKPVLNLGGKGVKTPKEDTVWRVYI